MTTPTPPAVSDAMREAVAPAYGIIDPDYARVFTQARCLAWAEGYALMMHGSFTRDLDLIAVPWTDRACEPEHLVNRIAATADLTVAPSSPGIKAHGRLAWTLLFQGFGDPRFVDMSIMPRASEIARLTGERDAARELAGLTWTAPDIDAVGRWAEDKGAAGIRERMNRLFRRATTAEEQVRQLLNDADRDGQDHATVANDRAEAAEAETARLRAGRDVFRNWIVYGKPGEQSPTRGQIREAARAALSSQEKTDA